MHEIKQRSGHVSRGRRVWRMALLCAGLLCVGAFIIRPVFGSGVSPCPQDMAYLPTGDYSFGTSPNRIIHIMKLCKAVMGNCDEMWFAPESNYYGKARIHGVCMDRFEYPNRVGKLPATGMDWSSAMKLCQARNKTLCTDLEWELACTAGTRRAWPFGETYSENRCNTETKGLEPSGSRAACVSSVGGGVYDLSGNAAEWTRSSLTQVYPLDTDLRSPRVVKGGSYRDHPLFTRCAFREAYDTDVNYDNFGFRCCGYPR